VIAVVVILAIVAAVAIPTAIGTTDMAAVSAARRVSAALEYAQSQAITQQEPVEVTFDTGGEWYELRMANTSELVIHPMTKDAYRVEFGSEDRFRELDIVSADFGGSSVVEFDELGAPTSQGSVTLQAGPHVYVVDVAAATGRVTVETGSQ